MTVISIDSTMVGTKLATVADTKIVGLSITNSPPPIANDQSTQLCLVDAATAADLANPTPTLYAADLIALSYIFGFKPGWPANTLSPTPAYPLNLGPSGATFSKGVWVKSCPAHVTFSLTTG